MSSATHRVIPVGLDERARRQFDALMLLHSRTLANFRGYLSWNGLIEITESSLIEIALACQAPLDAGLSFAETAGSCERHLEFLSSEFQRAYFTVSNGTGVERAQLSSPRLTSFPSFTSIQAVVPCPDTSAELAFAKVLSMLEECTKFCVRDLVESHHTELFALGSDLNYLCRVLRRSFIKISYDEAIRLLNDDAASHYRVGHTLGLSEERALLSYFCNIPVFVLYPPATLQQMKGERSKDEQYTFRVELLLPKLGLSASGAVLNDHSSTAQTPPVLPDGNAENSHISAGKLTLGMRYAFNLAFERIMGFLLGSKMF